jgi:hypothetical protein
VKQIKDAINDLKTANIKNISEEVMGNIQPYVMMRWLYGTYNFSQILNLNSIVNTLLGSNYKHPLLSFYLMSAITTDNHCKWIKPAKKITENKKELLLVAEYFKCSVLKAKDYLSILTIEDIKEIKESLGDTN